MTKELPIVNVHAICSGIPRILVDVRHDASHNELPSLTLLRLASSAALSWLHSAYWQRQADHLQSCRAHISSLLQVQTFIPTCEPPLRGLPTIKLDSGVLKMMTWAFGVRRDTRSSNGRQS